MAFGSSTTKVNVPDQEQEERFSHEAILPLELIREHTKTDDIPSVSDAQLDLYRSAAIQTAEAYTGLLLSGNKPVIEVIRIPEHNGQRPQSYFIHETEYPVGSPFVYYYGVKNMAVQEIRVSKGTTKVRLPSMHLDFGLGCCDPCRTGTQAQIMYRTGMACVADIPAPFKVGALKYIAHLISNPGDLVKATLSTGQTTGSFGVADGSNPALASGAIEIWRTMKRDAI